MRRLGLVFLAVVLLCGVLAPWLSSFRYDEMLREAPSAHPSKQHLLGTDESGRDRFSRLLYGTQVSIALAPAAALLSTLLAAVCGGVAAMNRGIVDRCFLLLSDLFLCLPWMFLLLTARALLPLNTGPLVSATLTFLLLGVLGWAGPARIARTRVRFLLRRDDWLLARACGMSASRAFCRFLLPNVSPILAAQFWVMAPLFILSEANLSLIGLGVSEPLPSWGNLLRALESFQAVSEAPWILAPLLLLILTVTAMQMVLAPSEVPST